MIAKGEPSIKRKESLSHGTTGSVGNDDPHARQRGIPSWISGCTPLIFRGYLREDGSQPEEPQRALSLTSQEGLRLVVMPDEQGRYHFDEMGYENLPEYLGYLVGPLAPLQAAYYRNQQA